MVYRYCQMRLQVSRGTAVIRRGQQRGANHSHASRLAAAINTNENLCGEA
jgi:hypothetical protein